MGGDFENRHRGKSKKEKGETKNKARETEG